MRESHFRASGARMTLLVFMLLLWLNPVSAQNELTRLGGSVANDQIDHPVRVQVLLSQSLVLLQRHPPGRLLFLQIS